MEAGNLDLLREGLGRLGGPWGEKAAAAPATVEMLARHLAMVGEWNARVNLTAITAEREMVIKHALDSATVLGAVEVQSGARILDVGTGAGFPGLVLGLLVPLARVVLLESLQKRCRFLAEVVADLGLGHAPGRPGRVQVVWGRAENWGGRPGMRAAFDLVTARAVAELRVLAEYCLPFVQVGGLFVAMKGPNVAGEVEGAGYALDVLGGEVEAVHRVDLPEGAGERSLVVVRKRRPTPAAYPRKAGIPERKPLIPGP